MTTPLRRPTRVWKLVSTKPPPQPTSFTVDVDDQGNATVKCQVRPAGARGEPRASPASWRGRERARGEGPAAPSPRAPLGVPQPTHPAHKLKVTVQPAKGGPSPITLAWKAVEGAEGYEVELMPARGEKRTAAGQRHQAQGAARRGRLPLERARGDGRGPLRGLGRADLRGGGGPGQVHQPRGEAHGLEVAREARPHAALQRPSSC